LEEAQADLKVELQLHILSSNSTDSGQLLDAVATPLPPSPPAFTSRFADTAKIGSPVVPAIKARRDRVAALKRMSGLRAEVGDTTSVSMGDITFDGVGEEMDLMQWDQSPQIEMPSLSPSTPETVPSVINGELFLVVTRFEADVAADPIEHVIQQDSLNDHKQKLQAQSQLSKSILDQLHPYQVLLLILLVQHALYIPSSCKGEAPKLIYRSKQPSTPDSSPRNPIQNTSLLTEPGSSTTRTDFTKSPCMPDRARSIPSSYW
jgi:hypothetical protein